MSWTFEVSIQDGVKAQFPNPPVPVEAKLDTVLKAIESQLAARA